MYYIGRLSITDTYGVRGTIAFDPGTVITIISGQNAVGKSSILESIEYVLSGGFDPAVIHDWGTRAAAAKRSVVEFDLRDSEDGSLVANIKKTTTAKGGTLDISDADGREIKPPKTYIDSLAKLIAIDPSRLLQAAPKDFIKTLLQIMPLKFEVRGEIFPAVPNWTEGMNKIVREQVGPGIDVIDADGIKKLRDTFFSERTVVNRQKEEADGAVKSLSKSLPSDDDVDWVATRANLEARVMAARNSFSAQLSEIDLQEKDAAAMIDREAEAAKDRMRVAMNDKRINVRTAKEPEIDALNAQATEAKEKSETQLRAAGVRQEIDRNNKKFSQCDMESEYLSMAIRALEDLEKRKLAELPIPGLSVRSDGVTYNGVPWHQVNTAKRTELVVTICAMLHKREGSKLSFMFLDNTESLDTENWIALQEALKNSGWLQFLAIRRSDGPLAIEVVGKDGKSKAVKARAETPSVASLAPSKANYPD